MIFELTEDFRDASAAMPKNHARLQIIQLLAKALQLDSGTLIQHPHLLLQFLWHSCFWYDSSEASNHYIWPDAADAKDSNRPWNARAPKLCDMLLGWVGQATKITRCDGGRYAVVVQDHDVIPCKVEGPE